MDSHIECGTGGLRARAGLQDAGAETRPTRAAGGQVMGDMHPCLVTLKMTALQPSHCPRDTKPSPRPGWYSRGCGFAKHWLHGH